MEKYKLKIKEFRKARRMTQKQLAEKVGISRNFLSEIENGIYDIRLSLLCDIAEALDTTPRELIEYKKSKRKKALD